MAGLKKWPEARVKQTRHEKSLKYLFYTQSEINVYNVFVFCD